MIETEAVLEFWRKHRGGVRVYPKSAVGDLVIIKLHHPPDYSIGVYALLVNEINPRVQCSTLIFTLVSGNLQLNKIDRHGVLNRHTMSGSSRVTTIFPYDVYAAKNVGDGYAEMIAISLPYDFLGNLDRTVGQDFLARLTQIQAYIGRR
ncbi:MAG: hypothetical protein A3C79_02325 [Candidatus Taylorbacteria bacterium RIFCSPHIGHO2_02_FULL_45_28]|uniref:Uncharacterized protein n=1 Tax=Candidatus Taylorbacteria bacterium RIFCSPHIGHO2_12_FULL_45_16 TaxID=1802315 RepID=A0A1G2MXW7_9BACT|nr:MAG: hypothetical protein A2830_03140 [Candidatus Taylorbacteria bacterium RIFCSPHIGHO2_01_FULL_44_110]OHA25291.1 MAG: hypothetical protein A3C79_02325 [Candidatus Taylorbacteria bacterium RIFCSPHIGHO2_02_FULL_45_28]OHA28678.1 MAG: hypothetical protein A3F51_02795 [Candidatus Taylorbacteria bacterium RIFCSPHIGHO2_12_FULL_45_16]OHA32951.1 MAG: hypothetical protein A3A23_00970 [Candidatus Taylorbacteria bacterium RIFCSPLOWO2_01_FULL_45_59]OHA38441.1 MAG: hypothetical protein A3I98_00475 [Candi